LNAQNEAIKTTVEKSDESEKDELLF